MANEYDTLAQANEYDDLLAKDQKRPQLRASLLGAVKQNPDEAAQATQLSRTTGLPAPIIARNLQSVRQRATIDALDAAIDPASVVGRKMADPGFAALGHDDVGNLNSIEQVMRSKATDRTFLGTLGDVAVTGLKGAVGLPQAFVGLANIPTLGKVGKGLESVGIRFNESQQILDSLYSPAQQRANRAVRGADGFLDTIVTALQNPSVIAATVGESLPQMLGGMAVARGLLRVAPSLSPLFAGAVGEGVVGAGSAAEQTRAKTADNELTVKQSLSAVASGIGDTVFAMMGGKLSQRLGIEDIDTALARGGIDRATADTVKKGFVRRMAEGGITEGVFEELPQSAQEQIWQNFAADKPLLEGVPNAAAMGLLAGAVTGGGFNALVGAHPDMHVQQEKAAAAVQNAAAMEQISKLATESKLRARDPHTFQEFVHAATEGGPVQDVYLDARVLAQSGVDVKALVQASPTAAAQLDHALATGGDVIIPVFEYAARIAGTPLDHILAPHLRTSEDALSLDEAQRFYQGQAASFQETAAKVMEEKAGDAVHAASAKAVETKLFDQLAAAGRFTPDVNNAYASLMRDFYVSTASRMGLTPEQMYERYPLQIKAESVAGAQRLDQPGDLETIYRGKNTSNKGGGYYTSSKDFAIEFTQTGREQEVKTARIRTSDIYTAPELPFAGDVAAWESAKAEAMAKGFKAMRVSEGSGQPHSVYVFDKSILKQSPNPLQRLAQAVKTALGVQKPAEPKAEGARLDMGQFFQGQATPLGKNQKTIMVDGVERPAQNSNGQPIHPTEEGVRNFWRWFGSSRVVDGQGRPLVVYHGTDANFSEFDTSRLGQKGAQPSKLGHWFTDDPEYSGVHGDITIPAYLKLENPLKVRTADALQSLAKTPEKLNAHDGISVSPTTERFANQTVRNAGIYAVKSSTQIKSTGNTGAFDAKNPNILQQSGQGNRGEISFGEDVSQEPSVITLFKNADLSTALHELGHFQLEVMANIAGRPDAPQAIVDDLNTVFEWFGIKGDETVKGGEKSGSLEQNDAPYSRSESIPPDVEAEMIKAYNDDLPSQEEQLRDAMENNYWPEGWEYSTETVSNLEDMFGDDRFDWPKELIAALGNGNEVVTVSERGNYEYYSPKDAPSESEFNDRVADEIGVNSPVTSLDDMLDESRLNGFRGESATSEAFKAMAKAEGWNADVQGTRYFDIWKDNTDPKTKEDNPTITLHVRVSDHSKTAGFSRPDHAKDIHINISPSYGRGNEFHGADTFESALWTMRNASIDADGDILVGSKNIALFQNQAQGGDEGIKGNLPKRHTPLEIWNAMSLEEKRPYHEQFARGFEAYLFEGKSPSLEMSSVFARFRAWLVSVYKSIKALNVEISDDIRKVFDRLVATEEAIKQAEAARTYNPIFKTAEEMGATPEEWTEYQQTNEQATQDSISGLQNRSLRDMRWLTNARGRILKQLQKDAAAKRREVRMEARREVLTDPTYKAWQFLTRKMGAEDQLPAMQQKSDPDTLDETKDSLLVAIAKLGGLNKASVISEWGTDPADKPSSGLFGKPVWRIEGGLSIDGMAEALAQHGYLPKNEHGQYDLHDFEEAFADEMRGNLRYSTAHEYTQEMPAGYQVVNPAALDAGRLDLVELRQLGIPDDVISKLESRGMIATGEGLHPDIVAEIVGGFTSGDEMVRKVAAADDINDVIEGVTDQHMLERYGDIASQEALARAADYAIHNEARGRFVATELKALSKTVGPVRAITKAAKDFAESVIARKLMRDIKPLQYAAAEVRAGKAAEKALIDGDTAQAVIEKRNQLVQNYSTRAAYDALDEIDTAVRYLRKFDKEGTRKNIDHEFTDQIDQLLERFDLRTSVTNKAAAQRSSLLSWVESQREQGFEPDIPPEILSEALRKPYKELTLEELRGLVDTVKQVEHLGRLKKKLLTAQDQAEFQAVVATLTASIEANAKHTADLRTRNTTTAQLKDAGNRFLAMHRKMASVAREMDGFKDGGPMWEYFIRSMNEAGDKETTRRADATARLYKLVKPFDKMGGKGQFFETLGASFNREERIAIALNLGNEGNTQRLLDGEGWTMEQLKPLLDSITPEEADFVQAIWDFFESYRPEIGAKETRVYGKEPKWVDPAPIMLGGRQLRGGYYPIKYDPARSGRAEQHAEAEAAKQQMRGAYTTATTRRSFTKMRAREVTGRPLIYSFAGLYQGTTEVIHDLSWHEWLIDVNRLIRAVDAPIRAHYGAETVGIFKKAIEDIATGDSQVQNVFERGLNHLRTGATVAGLGWNLTTSLLQPLGLTQSMARIGSGWVVKGMGQWIKSPLETMDMIKEKSAMMTSRAQTMQREINEIQNQVNGSSLDPIRATFFVLIQKMQLLADVPTWLGAYEKHTASGETEARAIALADQAVLDSQGGGQVKDLAQIQRGHPALKLFTNFYSYFNVSYNLAAEKTNEKIGSPKMYPSLAMDYILLLIAPSVLATLVRNIMSGDDDDLADKLAADQISYLLGLMVGVREITAAVQKVAGVEQFKGSYGGPAGLRLFQEIDKLGTQIGQGEADAALLKSANNVGGILLHYPSGQINRSVEGTAAIMEGKTDNPAAVILGPPRK